MKTYKIVVLGASGSGKTVFLASLYKQLLSQREDIGFFLEISPAQTRELVEKYRQIATGKEWPPSADRSKDDPWTFTCSVQNNELHTYPVMEFVYWDYAGEKLTDANGESDEKLEEVIQTADVLLCLLDGQKLLLLMQDEKKGYELLQRDLPNMLPYLQRTDKPVHFVLTKWDLFLTDEDSVLKSELDPLKPVRDFLLRKDGALRDFVHKRARKSPVRLIPMSAVGKNFARFEDGQMKKVGQNPEPFQVEMPLVCVLADVLRAHREQLKKEFILIENSPVKSTSMTMQKFKGFVIGWLVRIFGRVVVFSTASKVVGHTNPLDNIEVAMEDAIIDKVADWFQRKATESEKIKNAELQELQRQKEEKLKAIRDEESALEYTLDCFRLLFLKLQQEFPSSDFARA